MIVILSYYSDGSDEPKLKFILDGPRGPEMITKALQRAEIHQKCVQVYEIETLWQRPVQIAGWGPEGTPEGTMVSEDV